MVDALRHVHGLVVPGGCVIVLHPIAEGVIEVDGEAFAVVPEPEWMERELAGAERGLAEVVRGGLLELEVETEFDLYYDFDAPEDLIDLRQELLEPHPELEARIRALPSPPRLRHRLVLRRLRRR